MFFIHLYVMLIPGSSFEFELKKNAYAVADVACGAPHRAPTQPAEVNPVCIECRNYRSIAGTPG